MAKLISWGRLPQYKSAQIPIYTEIDKPELLQLQKGIPYGMGRSYGDACLSKDGALWHTRMLDKFINFDTTTGQLSCEAGVLLGDIQKICVPQGWMLPVTPGTQFATVGGAIANDVHGKNHHRFGSFANHVQQLTLLRSDGQIIKCGPDTQPSWFAATVGGIGLTGVILNAQIQLRPINNAYLETETIAFSKFDEFFTLSEESEEDWEYTVSWIDCLRDGKGLFHRANHCTDSHHHVKYKKKSLNFPLVPPFSLVNHYTLSAFNKIYYAKHKRLSKEKVISHYQPFFYPLDHITHWNRMYGPKGFYQYQCVIPHEHAGQAIQEMLATIAQAKQGSFLAVLKAFGDQASLGMLSFPRRGITLALDFPNKGNKTHRLFTQLDNIVTKAQGCLYLAKDARMSKVLFEASYPGLDEFLTYRDPQISSRMSQRLMDY